MDPLTVAYLALQVLDKSLDIFKIILTDIPQARRTQAWEDWYKAWDPIMELIRARGLPLPELPTQPTKKVTP